MGGVEGGGGVQLRVVSEGAIPVNKTTREYLVVNLPICQLNDACNTEERPGRDYTLVRRIYTRHLHLRRP